MCALGQGLATHIETLDGELDDFNFYMKKFDAKNSYEDWQTLDARSIIIVMMHDA